MYHNVGEAAYLAEPLDDRIVSYLKKTIRGGCRNVKDFQSRADEFVKTYLFFGERPPESYRRRFRPNRKKVKNLITAVKNEQCFSKDDQQNVIHLIEGWKKWNNVYFNPRYENITSWSMLVY